jgi:hypothetical protein
VERRKMERRPTYVGEDGKVYASKESSSPATLVRMILLDGPLGERDLVRSILILALAALVLSALTSVLTWVV